MDIEKLYREYFTPVYRYTLSLVHDPDMADHTGDILQSAEEDQ